MYHPNQFIPDEQKSLPSEIESKNLKLGKLIFSLDGTKFVPSDPANTQSDLNRFSADFLKTVKRFKVVLGNRFKIQK